MPLVILLPLLIVLLAGVSAATVYGLRSRPSHMPVELTTPVQVEDLSTADRRPADVEEDDVEERGPPVPLTLTNIGGNPVALNDLMYARLSAHYGVTKATHGLDDLLERFRKDNP